MNDYASSATTPAGPRPTHPEVLPVGTRVEVQNSYSRAWSSGFQVAAVIEGRYRLRRTADQYDLPADFAPHEVRPTAM